MLEWDHRNRLASISDYDDTHALQQKFSYLYDAFDRLVGKRSDTDGNGTLNATEAYIYDGDQIVLQFGDDDAADLAASDLTHRYLWGPNVDQLLAEENVTSLTSAGTVDWALGDHLGTIRDWARYSSGSTTILDHAEYDAFGNRLDAPAVDALFGWTGRPFDQDTQSQWNGGLGRGTGRWYDAPTGRWTSEDRIWDDRSNTYRYVGNAPTIFRDPSGLGFWSDYWYYLTHPGEMDTDLRIGQGIAVGVAAGAAVGAVGVTVAGVGGVSVFGGGGAAAGGAAAGGGATGGAVAAGGAATGATAAGSGVSTLSTGATITFGHGARHLAGTCLTAAEVEAAIASNIGAIGAGLGSSWGWIMVNGQWIQYRLHVLTECWGKVGTYVPVPGPITNG